MPFTRPTLTDLRTQAKQDIAVALPGANALLRFSNLGITADVLAGMTNLHYGYLDWIALQSNPFTATDEYLEAWAALKNVFRKPATQASGTVRFPGTNGYSIPSGTLVSRGDGIECFTTASGTVSGGYVSVPVTVQADPSGQTGAFGNCDVGTAFSLGTAISGVQAAGSATVAFTGGADIETDDSLRTRMLEAYQAQSGAGNATDFENWAEELPGVDRAWCVPNGYGPGTVLLYFMEDTAESAHGGFPQGTNGVSSNETRDTAATGDQLIVANYLWALQPVTALVYAVAPTAQNENFTISGSAGFSSTTKSAIAAAISDAFVRLGSAKGSTIDISDINEAIGAVSGSQGFLITAPSGNSISIPLGKLPKLGTITWTP